MFELTAEDGTVKLQLMDSELHIYKQDSPAEERIDVDDIIGISKSALAKSEESNDPIKEVHLHTIQRSDTKTWTKKELVFTGGDNICKQFTSEIESRLKRLGRPKNLLILISPMAGSHQGEKIFYEEVKPLFDLANISAKVIVSEYTNHFRTMIPTCDLDDIDGIVVFGGDSSFSQCLNGMFERTQKAAKIDYNDPDVKLSSLNLPIGQIPTGTGNALSLFCYGHKDIITAALHIIRGKTKRLGIVNAYSNKCWIGSCCVVASYGLIQDILRYTENFRWMKTMRYLFIPAYYFLMKTLPLFDATIRVRYRDGVEVEKRGQFTNVTASVQDYNSPDIRIGSKNWKEGFFEIGLWHPTSRYQLWKDLIVKPRISSTQPPDFIETIDATAMDIVIHKTNLGEISNKKMRYDVDLDGENVEIDHKEVHIRLVEQMATVFSSL